MIQNIHVVSVCSIFSYHRKIIEKIGADYVLPEITSSSDQYMKEAYSKISQNLTKRVISKYADDLEAFGYNC